MRGLLRSLDDVERWALEWAGRSPPGHDAPPANELQVGPSLAPVPRGWHDRSADADVLAAYFARPLRPPLPEDPLARTPTLLDQVFGPLFGGADGSGGRYFSDRVQRGLIRPDATRLQRLDDLVPGSRRAFEAELSGMDVGWFYDALDFTNPWFARLYLWRAQDPDFEDAGWDGLLAPSTVTTALTVAPALHEQRHAAYTVSAHDAEAFEGLIGQAAAFTVQPSLLVSPVGELDAVLYRVHAAAAAAGSPGKALEMVAVVSEMAPERQWAILSNAVAACRLARLLDLDTTVPTWWLRSVRQGMAARLDAADREWYCPLSGRRPALITVLTALDQVVVAKGEPNIFDEGVET
ncbi:hypothetical protein [Dokdonella sp.]|uniref:hypothetical protein n=1 Tax=Dokdonella sp. TaxID=2291710 RepID=UPI003782F849